MALLFIITVLSLTGTMVDSASNVTGCDTMPGKACKQGSCLQPPCMMLCGLTTSQIRCVQICNSSCDAVKCTAYDQCEQTCSTGNCKSMTCDALYCVQRCESATCGVMTCVKNSNNLASGCKQSSKSGQMICETEVCIQNCPNGNCNLICSSSVKQCNQTCDGGNCQYKCEAQDSCSLSCKGGSCTNTSTTKMPPTTTPTSSGYCLQMTAAAGLALIFALVTFV